MCSKRFSRAWVLGACLLLWSETAVRADEVAAPLTVESVVLRPLRAAEVPARQTGLLRELVIREGEQVAEGQLLASLDAREMEHTIRQAELEHELASEKATNRVQLRYAEKALEVARAELGRSNESIENFAKSISQSQLDVERLTVEKLVLEIEQARHELSIERFGMKLKQNALEAARLRLAQHHLRAPFAGTVALVRGRVGEWVEVGSPVLRLVAVDRLRAEGFLPEVALTADDGTNRQLVGSKVRLIVELPHGSASEFPGILRFVSPEMDPVTRQVRVWAEVENGDRRLRPGQRGRLVIESGGGPSPTPLAQSRKSTE